MHRQSAGLSRNYLIDLFNKFALHYDDYEYEGAFNTGHDQRCMFFKKDKTSPDVLVFVVEDFVQNINNVHSDLIQSLQAKSVTILMPVNPDKHSVVNDPTLRQYAVRGYDVMDFGFMATVIPTDYSYIMSRFS